MIANCIESVRWCQHVLVIDNGSTDATAQIAEKLGARVVSHHSKSFSDLRTQALKFIKTDWLFYIDSDERVQPTLAREIQVHLETNSGSALRMPRANWYYGHLFSHGGWSPDYVTRVFRKTALIGWHGEVHESPDFEGDLVTLHTPLLHFSHRSSLDGLSKTLSWTPIEAKLLFESQVPPVTLLTILKKGVAEFVRRAYLKQGYRDGLPGLVEAVTQAINRMLVYIQVWELQQKPTLPEIYQSKETEIASEWRAELAGRPK